MISSLLLQSLPDNFSYKELDYQSHWITTRVRLCFCYKALIASHHILKLVDLAA